MSQATYWFASYRLISESVCHFLDSYSRHLQHDDHRRVRVGVLQLAYDPATSLAVSCGPLLRCDFELAEAFGEREQEQGGAIPQGREPKRRLGDKNSPKGHMGGGSDTLRSQDVERK